MKELIYKVEFLSDIILQATSNTEGKIEVLDFIPGSNFLGIVAKDYDKFEDSFAIFHSGAVKFGDGTILHNDKPTFKMPLSFFHEKLNDTTIYNHHKIDDFTKFNQLKQKRDGYITDDLEFVELDYNYLQKSAYDKNKRRSKDSQMYGYRSLSKGTMWQFSIKIDNGVKEKDIELLKQSIEGKHRLGKSKSAEYGLIRITPIGDGVSVPYINVSGETIIYAKSRIALIDNEGNPTLDLKYLFDRLASDNIDYKKTQIKTSTFTPYNTKRQTKDYERVCINSGSVIVLKDYQDKIPQFIGAYISEGFGEILVNPEFLKDYSFSFKTNIKDSKETEKQPIKSHLAKFLKQKEDKKIARLKLGESVANFIKSNKSLYTNIKNSQWGKIRSICTKGDDDFKTQIKEYISSGKVTWEEKQISTLLKDNHTLEFIKLLSIQMPKQGGKND